MKGDDEVHAGVAEGPTNSPDTGEQVYVADFSELTRAGEYYVKVEGGRSAPFVVGDDSLEEALELTMLGLYGQRCGVKVELEHDGDEFSHEACHLAPASLSRVGGGQKDDTGGWHDAGDYGKYVVNGAFAVAFLLKAHEHFPDFSKDLKLRIPESGDDVPDLLDEARVELEWILKVQFEDGSFSHKVTGNGFEGTVMPSQDTQGRVFVSASSTGTADATAVLALAARIYADLDEEFAERCLEAARRGQAWLDEHPEEVEPDLTGVTTGNYTSRSGDSDERTWAWAELFETTGEREFLEALEAQLEEARVDGPFDWANVRNLGLSTYVMSRREGRAPSLLSGISRQFLGVANGHVSFAKNDAYGRGFGSYYWGSNGSVARLAFNLVTAHYIEPSADYLDAIQIQLDHLFGRNYYGRSFVTGLGARPVQKPHHRPSEADSIAAPWPGLLIGGPHAQQSTDPNALPALTWTDVYDNYLHNEVAINWNTALAYALVAVQAADEDSMACERCLIDDDGAGGAGGSGGSAATGGAGGALGGANGGN